MEFWALESGASISVQPRAGWLLLQLLTGFNRFAGPMDGSRDPGTRVRLTADGPDSEGPGHLSPSFRESVSGRPPGEGSQGKIYKGIVWLFCFSF